MRTMYLDVTKKVGDASAIKTAEQIIKELEEKLAVAIEALEKMRAWGVFDDSDVERWRLCEATLEKIKG